MHVSAMLNKVILSDSTIGEIFESSNPVSVITRRDKEIS